jgi:hypothetical protein
MSLLPNNTYANPANSFYGEAGAGAANSLQSPAEIIPDATLGDALLNINSAPGAAIAVLTVRGGATGEGNVVIGSQGQDYLLSASGTNDVLTLTAVPAQVGQVSVLEYRPATGILTLGDGLAGGFVETTVPLFVGATPVNGNAVKIASFDATTGTINNTLATGGTVKIGSSVANPQGVAVIDDGAGTATTEFVGNGGAKVTVRGGANGVVTPAAIFSGFNAGSPSSLTVGTKLFNNILTVTDTNGGVGTAVIGGNGGNNILFTGSTNNAAATISTDRLPGNTGVLTIGGSVGAPAIQFSDSGTAFTQNVQTSLGTNLTIRGDIDMATDGTIINYANYQSGLQAAIGSGVSVIIPSTNPPPNGVGLYCVTVLAQFDITANVSGVAYWDGSLWRGGSTGNAAYRIQTAADFQSLTFFNTSGTTMNGVYRTNVYQILGAA